MPVWGVLLSLITAGLWAVSPIMMRIGMRRAGPNEVNPIRSIGFLVTMTAIMLYVRPDHLPTLTPLLVLGLLVNTSTSTVMGDQMYIYAINKIGASLAVSISCGYPLITTFFSIWLLGERITPLIWAGTLMIILGLLVIRYDATRRARAAGAEKKQRAALSMLKGILLAAGAAFCWGVNMPLAKLLMVGGGWSPVEMYFMRAVTFTIVVWTIRFVQRRKLPHLIMPLHRVKLRSWAAFMGSGAIALAIGGTLYGVCINALPVSVVTPITASSPFVTVLIARLVCKEKLSRLQNIGIALVIAGALAVSL